MEKILLQGGTNGLDGVQALNQISRGPTRLHDTLYRLTCRQLGHTEIIRRLQVNPRLRIRAEVPRQA
jgi:hypothetical protein